MKLFAFSLLDQKVGTYGIPFFMPHLGQAVRACIDIGQDLDTTVGRHPSDFALVELGSFDDVSGMFEQSMPINHGTVLGMLPARSPGQAELFVPSRSNGVEPHSDERA